MPIAATRRTAVLRPQANGVDKRDAILKAATQIFARNGYFQSQVADIARAAGVAAGTVYLYFRSKDDLLVSLFERTMREALAEGRRALAGIDDPRERLTRIARLHLDRLGRDRELAVVFQVELRQSTKFMERFSSTYLRDYLGMIRETIAAGQETGVFRRDVNPTIAAKVFFGALDEMATNWILSRRRYSLAGRGRCRGRFVRRRRCGETNRSVEKHSAIRMTINSVAVLGAGTMGAQIALHCANAGIPVLLLDLTPELAREGLEKAVRLRPDPQFTPDVRRLVATAGFDDGLSRLAAVDWIMEAVVERLDIKQQLLARVDAVATTGLDRQLEHLGHPHRTACGRPQ